jgi:hypothetical protein
MRLILQKEKEKYRRLKLTFKILNFKSYDTRCTSVNHKLDLRINRF